MFYHFTWWPNCASRCCGY